MRELLLRAGFRNVQRRRADCAYCRGSSRGTVSFTARVGFCHRCGWRGNVVTLLRALGLRDLPRETEQHRKVRAKVKEFEGWLNEMYREVAAEYRELGSKAALARRVLVHFPDCKPAWAALARFYNAEARLSAELDALTFEKASSWVEQLATPVELFEKWERVQR